MIPVSILSDKMRSGVSLAIYIILSEVHRNTLEAMRITTGVSGLKARLSHMIVIICMHYLESPVVKKCEFLFFVY